MLFFFNRGSVHILLYLQLLPERSGTSNVFIKLAEHFVNIHSNWYSKLVGGFNLSSNRIISPNRVKIKHIGNRQPEKLSPKNLQAPLPMNFAAATLNPPVNSQHRCIGSQHENQEVSTFKICFKKKIIQTKTKQDVCTNKNHLFMFMFFAYGWFSMQKNIQVISSPLLNATITKHQWNQARKKTGKPTGRIFIPRFSMAAKRLLGTGNSGLGTAMMPCLWKISSITWRLQTK